MRWVRLNRHWGARLALLALALQLVLSFGHLHVQDLGLAAAPAASQAQASAAGDGAPSPHHSGAHDVCGICATLSLVSASLLPVMVALPAPFAPQPAWPPDLRSLRLDFALASSFQARAPPRA